MNNLPGLGGRAGRIALRVAVLLLVVLVVSVALHHHRPAHASDVWFPPPVVPTASPTPTPSPGATPTPPRRPVPRVLAGPTEHLTPLTTVTGSAGAKSALLYRVPTTKKAVFVTIDDGGTRDERIVDLLDRTHLPVTAFLVENAVNVDPSYWQRFAKAGGVVENHTVSHPYMTSLGYEDQKGQICTAERRYAQLFGRRPTLFRPPYGKFNDSTLRAVSACGLSKTILWDATYVNGHLATWGPYGLRPGDIVILHFNSSTYDDLNSLIDLIRRDGLGVGRLEQFLAPPPTPAPTRSPTPTPTPRPTTKPIPTPAPKATVRPSSPRPSPSPSPHATPTSSVAPSTTP